MESKGKFNFSQIIHASLAVCFLAAFGAMANPSPSPSPYTPWRTEPFDANTLRSSRSSFIDLSRFSMQQSYTMSYVSGPNGSQSSGVYLNQINYALTSSLSLYTDIGFYNIFHSNTSGLGSDNRGLADVNTPSFVIPQFGLHYQPSDSFSLMVNVITPDAYEMGYSPYSPYSSFFRPYGWDRQDRFGSRNR